MIDPKSLRIGNLLNFKHLTGYITRIQESNAELMCGNILVKSDYNDLAGIPLSPSLLERAGFQKGRISAGANKPEFYTFGRIRIDDMFVSGFEFVPTSTRIAYFHELQNIVRDLTGQELELKP